MNSNTNTKSDQDLRKSVSARHAVADSTEVRQGGATPLARFCVSPNVNVGTAPGKDDSFSPHPSESSTTSNPTEPDMQIEMLDDLELDPSLEKTEF